MIERYTRPEMQAIWSQDAKFNTWLAVELAVLEVQEQLGVLPADAQPGVASRVRQKAAFDVARIDAIELEVKHDVIAFLTSVAELVGEESRFVHLGMTSSDLIDTALALQIQQSGELLLAALDTLRATVFARAQEHRNTVMVGRSHGIHGEPITFGLKLLGWVDALDRQRERLVDALEENRVGQLSGAMGTYAHLPPAVEAAMCQKLNLKPAKTTTQVIARDIHAQFLLVLASLASSVEQFAVEIRHLQRTDVLEAEEPFTVGQKGSSAMPHKRNPVGSENLTGLARLVRSYALPALENIALWHERDISHSSVERVILPDACILTHYMLHRLNGIMAGLVVYPENMRRNMNRFGGVIFSQRVLLALVGSGMLREDAYRLVQRNAHAAWNQENGSFLENLLADAEVTACLSPADIRACFDPQPMLAHVESVFHRFEKPVAFV
ncbi:MAG: adenylosuccinate lyase [Candidatus Melainabacteria bacterium]|nr:adenylosuccinate lyase [Candidatus Melainabacteria bacterium]